MIQFNRNFLEDCWHERDAPLHPEGLYRTVFNVSPERVEGQRIHLVFHAVGSAVMVWVDGQPHGCNRSVTCVSDDQSRKAS